MDEAQGIDKNLAAEIREDIEREAPELSNYFMTAEIRRITRFSYGRIHYSLSKSKKHPLHGVKRGDRWFVNMIDVLQWAESVSREQQHRWTANADRLARLRVRAGDPTAPRPAPKVKPQREPVNRVPPGRRVYTVDEAAAALGVARQTFLVQSSRNRPLAHVERWSIGLSKAYDADAIDAYAADRVAAQQAPKAPKAPKALSTRVPEGQRVYDLAGVAITLKTTVATASTYLSARGGMADCPRWRGEHLRMYYDADVVDAYARDHRRFNQRPHPLRKQSVPDTDGTEPVKLDDHRVA